MFLRLTYDATATVTYGERLAQSNRLRRGATLVPLSWGGTRRVAREAERTFNVGRHQGSRQRHRYASAKPRLPRRDDDD